MPCPGRRLPSGRCVSKHQSATCVWLPAAPATCLGITLAYLGGPFSPRFAPFAGCRWLVRRTKEERGQPALSLVVRGGIRACPFARDKPTYVTALNSHPPWLCAGGWGMQSDERKSHGADPRLDEMEAKQKTSDPSYPSAPACAPSRIKDAHKAVPGQGSVTNDERREAWAQGTPSA